MTGLTKREKEELKYEFKMLTIKYNLVVEPIILKIINALPEKAEPRMPPPTKCKGCRHVDLDSTAQPCAHCSRCYTDRYQNRD